MVSILISEYVFHYQKNSFVTIENEIVDLNLVPMCSVSHALHNYTAETDSE